MINGNQIKMIHTLKSKLNIDDDLYRDMLAEFGIKSSKEFSSEDAKNFITNLQKQAVSAGIWKKNQGNVNRFKELTGREQMATPKQLRKIEAMWADVSYMGTSEERAKALRRFLFRIVKVSDLSFLTRSKVKKVIEALKVMKKN